MYIKFEDNYILIDNVPGNRVKDKEHFQIENKKLIIEYEKLNVGKNIFEIYNNVEEKMELNLSRPFFQINDDKVIYAYCTRNKNLIINVGDDFVSNSKLKIKKVKYKKDKIALIYNIEIINKWENINNFILKERKNNEEITIPITKTNGSLDIDAKLIDISGVYDIFYKVNIDEDNSIIKKIGRFRYAKEIFLKPGYITKGNKTLIVSPYCTYKARKLSFKVDIIPKEALKYLKIKNSDRNAWLIGEQKNKAQDNGYYFFKYLRENHPDENAYYVIEKQCEDYKKVQNLGNVVEFGSLEHFKLISKVKYLISTHHPDYLLPIQNTSILEGKKVFKIFLQHGVMGTKYMANFYGKYANNPFDVDKFIVSSTREQKMIIEDFEYEEAEVVITGLARFDNLLKGSLKEDIEIIIIPTWRDWLSNEINFENTEYFKRYLELNLKLKDKYNTVFILHTNMSQYKKNFTDMGIETYEAPEIDVQKMMKKSKLMITDYSSVSFDFSFLDKPVIYYQFDQERFLGSNGSHFDIYEELPGKILLSEQEVIEEVQNIENNNFKQEKAIKQKSLKLIKYKDLNSSKRIYEAVLNTNKKSHRKITKSTPFKKLFNLFRRSKIYFPSMKLYYNLIKFLPKKDYVFLESSNGKSFSDSPREIYLEWIKEHPNQKFILSYNGILPLEYRKNIKVVKRLSPEYFYYLGRSKYWINNQNFPFYIKNFKTIYLQTWHGTPIKKMLHDIKEIVGRDEGYKKRVSKAVKQWNYLLSPSKYASSCYKSAFRHESEVLNFGYPRNDIFFNKNTKLKEQLKNKYSTQGKKVILFAPTFRDDGIKEKGKYVQDLNLDYKDLYDRLSEEYIFIIKLHPLATVKNDLSEYSTFFKYSSIKEDINELMLITDLLITDYSSVMFDFLLTEKKTIIYAWDYEKYSKDRGFYLDFLKEAPGEIIVDYKSLVKEIIEPNINYNIKFYKDKYCSNEKGDASKNVVKFLKELN